jgi:hypothetical protein
VKAQLARARVKVKRLMRQARGLQAQARRM